MRVEGVFEVLYHNVSPVATLYPMKDYSEGVSHEQPYSQASHFLVSWVPGRASLIGIVEFVVREEWGDEADREALHGGQRNILTFV